MRSKVGMVGKKKKSAGGLRRSSDDFQMSQFPVGDGHGLLQAAWTGLGNPEPSGELRERTYVGCVATTQQTLAFGTMKLQGRTEEGEPLWGLDSGARS